MKLGKCNDDSWGRSERVLEKSLHTHVAAHFSLACAGHTDIASKPEQVA